MVKISARLLGKTSVMCRTNQTSDGDGYFNSIKVDSVLGSARVRGRVCNTWLSDGQLTLVVTDDVTRPWCRVDNVTVTSPLDVQVVCFRRVSSGSARHRDVIRGRHHLRLWPVNYDCPFYNTSLMYGCSPQSHTITIHNHRQTLGN